MRLSVLLLVTLYGASASAGVVFVTPQAGAQAIGPQFIEVTTDAINVDRVEFRVDGVLIGVARKVPYRVAYDFGTDLRSREIAAKVLSNGYRSSESATLRTAALTAGETMNVDLVEVPLRVHSTRPLRAGDLRVRENSVDQTIRELKSGRDAAHFAFVIDRSLSMGGGKLNAALHAVDGALKMLRDDDSASLVLFNHNVDSRRSLTRGAVTEARDVVPSGGTSLRDAVASIASSDRTYAIVITDGGDRNSVLNDERALRRISGAKTVVAALVFGTPNQFLEKATQNTGGTLSRTARNSVASDVRRVISDINSRYTLVYQSHGTREGWRTITIAGRRNDIDVVSARKGYFAE